jgi:hypothetical protein
MPFPEPETALISTIRRAEVEKTSSAKRSRLLWHPRRVFRVFNHLQPGSLVEIVGDGFCASDEQGQHAFSFHGDHIVLILQDPFDR